MVKDSFFNCQMVVEGLLSAATPQLPPRQDFIMQVFTSSSSLCLMVLAMSGMKKIGSRGEPWEQTPLTGQFL